MICEFTGVGLRSQHFNDFLNAKNKMIKFVEVHSDNYLSLGKNYEILSEIRKNYDVSLHGVGMSLGSADGINMDYLAKLKNLIELINPFLVSEHLSWSNVNNHFLPELLPLPYNDESLHIIANNIDKAQNFLGKEILIENPSSYFMLNNDSYHEAEFLNLLCKKTGCKILLDVNNIYVTSLNNDLNIDEYINYINKDLVKEFHLAGHEEKKIKSDNPNVKDQILLIDTHSKSVPDQVWDLYQKAINKFGRQYSVIEWDQDLPDLSILLQEAQKASAYLSNLVKKEVGYV